MAQKAEPLFRAQGFIGEPVARGDGPESRAIGLRGGDLP